MAVFKNKNCITTNSTNAPVTPRNEVVLPYISSNYYSYKNARNDVRKSVEKRSHSVLRPIPRQNTNYFMGNNSGLEETRKQEFVRKLKDPHQTPAELTRHNPAVTQDSRVPNPKEVGRPVDAEYLRSRIKTRDTNTSYSLAHPEYRTVDKFIEFCQSNGDWDNQLFGASKGHFYDVRLHEKQPEGLRDFFYLTNKYVFWQSNTTDLKRVWTHAAFAKQKLHYYKLLKMRFIKIFRFIKIMKMWKKNVIRGKRTQIKAQLQENLFVINPFFRSYLLKHQKQCLELRKLRILNQDQDRAKSVEGFLKWHQKNVQNHLRVKTQDLAINVEKNFNDCFETQLSVFYKRFKLQLCGIYGEQDNSHDEDYKLRLRRILAGNLNWRQIPISQLLEIIQMPENLMFGQITLLQEAFMKLLRLAIVFDKMVANALVAVQVDSVEGAQKQFEALTDDSQADGRLRLTYLKKLPDPKNDALPKVFQVTTSIADQQVEEDNRFYTKQIVDWDAEHDDILDWHLTNVVYSHLESEDLGLDSSLQVLVTKMIIAAMETEEVAQAQHTNQRALSSKAVRIQPDLADVKELFKNSLVDGFKAILIFQSIANSCYIGQFLHSLRDRQPETIRGLPMDERIINPAQVLVRHHAVKRMQRRIDALFTANYAVFEAVKQSYDLYFNWYHQCSDDLQAIDAALTREAENESQAFGLAIKKYTTMRTHLRDKLCDFLKVGILQVDLSRLNARLAGKVQECVQRTLDLMPVAQDNFYREYMDFIERCNDKLLQPYNTIENYLKLIDNVQATEKKLYIIDAAVVKMKDLTNLMRAHALSYEENKVLKINSMLAEIQRRIRSINENKLYNKYRNTLSMMIPGLQERFKEYEYTTLPKNQLDLDGDHEKVIFEIRENQARMLGFQQLAWTQEYQAKRLKLDIEAISPNEMSVRLPGGMARIHEGVAATTQFLEFQLHQRKFLNQLKEFNSLYLKELDMKTYETFFTEMKHFIQVYTKHYYDFDSVKDFAFKINSYFTLIKLFGQLKSPYLKKHHYEKISLILDTRNILEVQGVDQIIQLNLRRSADALGEVANTAVQENLISRQIEQHVDQLNSLNFEYEDTLEGIRIISNFEGLLTELYDIQLDLTNSLLDRYSSLFQPQLRNLIKNISTMQRNLEMLAAVQKKWMETAPMINILEIGKVIPGEFENFKRLHERLVGVQTQFQTEIDINHCLIFRRINDVTDNSLLHMLKELDAELLQVMVALDKFISLKRASQSRFWFLSNEQILKILSSVEDLRHVSNLLSTMFGNINEFITSDEGADSSLYCLISNDGERLPISNVKFVGVNPDVWLGELEEQIKYQVINDVNTFADTHLPSHEFEFYIECVNKQLAQSSLINSFIWQTASIDEILGEQDQKLGFDVFNEELTQLVTNMTHEVKHRKDKLLRIKLANYIATLVNNLNTNKRLCELNIRHRQDFEWQVALKWYQVGSKLNKEVLVYSLGSAVAQGQEQVGCFSRMPAAQDNVSLAVAVNTNRLCKSFSCIYGSETRAAVEEVANVFGLNQMSILCNKQQGAKNLSFELKGTVVVGQWLVLEAFDSLELETISVLAQYLLELRNAIDSSNSLAKITIFNSQITVSKKFHCVLIPNSSAFYSTSLGRYKACFNQFIQKAPRPELVFELKLFMAGFRLANEISRNVVQLFELMDINCIDNDLQKLTAFNLITVEALMRQAVPHQLRLDSYKYSNRGSAHNEWSSINYAVSSYFQDSDNAYIRLFSWNIIRLIMDNKITAQKKIEKTKSLREQVNEVNELLSNEFEMPYNKYLTDKTCTVINSLTSQQVVLLVGSSLTFKKTILNVTKTYYKQVKEVNYVVKFLNLSIVPPQLLFDHKTQKFIWSVLDAGFNESLKSKLRRKLKDTIMDKRQRQSTNKVQRRVSLRRSSYASVTTTNNAGDGVKLIVVDGYINNEEILMIQQFVASQNSALQHLVSSREKILVSTHSILNLAPSCVHSSHMIFVDNNILGHEYQVELRVEKFVKRGLPEESVRFLKESFFRAFENCVKVVQVNAHFETPQLVFQLFDQFEATVKHLELDWHGLNKIWISHISAQCIINVLGTVSTTASFVADRQHSQIAKILNSFPELNLSFSNMKDLVLEKREQRDRVSPHLVCVVPKFEQNPQMPLYEILVPTYSTYKNLQVLSSVQNAGKRLCVFGDHDVGKSVLVRNWLYKYCESKQHSNVWINYFLNASHERVQDRMLKSLKQLKKNYFSSSAFQTLSYVVDDLQLTASEPNSNRMIEYLRFFLTHNSLLKADGQECSINFENVILIQGNPHSMSLHNSRFFSKVLPFKIQEMRHAERKGIQTKFIKRQMMQHVFDPKYIQLNEELSRETQDCFRRFNKELENADLREFKPSLSNLMMLGDLNFQLKLNWVESEAWLRRFIHLEFSRIFRDRISPMASRVLAIYNKVVPEAVKFDDVTYVMSELFTPNYAIYEIPVLQNLIDKSLKDQNTNNMNRLTLSMTANMVCNIQRVTRNFKVTSRPLLLVGNPGAGRKSVLKLAIHMQKRAKLQLLSVTDDVNTLAKELSGAVLQAVRASVVLAIEDHSALASEKLHWVQDLFSWQNPLPLLTMEFFDAAKQAFVACDPDYVAHSPDAVFADLRRRTLQQLKLVFLLQNSVYQDRGAGMPCVPKQGQLCYMIEITPNGHEEIAHCQLRHLLHMHPFLEVTTGLWERVHALCLAHADAEFPYSVSQLVDCVEVFKRQVSAEQNAVLHKSYQSKNAIDVLDMTEQLIERENSKIKAIADQVELLEKELSVKLSDAEGQKAEKNRIEVYLLHAEEDLAALRVEMQSASDLYDQAKKKALGQYEQGLKQLRKVSGLMIHGLRSNSNLGEDMKKIVYCMLNVIDENFTRFDWALAVMRLNGSNTITTLLDFKVGSLPRATLLRIRNLVSEQQSEEQVSSVKNRNETVSLLLQWIQGVLDQWRSIDDAAPLWEEFVQLTNKKKQLDKTIAECTSKIHQCTSVISLFSNDISSTQNSIKKLRDSELVHLNKIKICELLQQLNETYFEHQSALASRYEVAKQTFLSRTLLQAVRSACCTALEAAAQDDLLRELTLILKDHGVECAHADPDKDGLLRRLHLLQSADVLVCPAILRKLEAWRHAVRFVQYADPDRLTLPYFSQLRAEEQVTLEDYNSIFGKNTLPDKLFKLLAGDKPLVLQNAPATFDCASKFVFGMSRKVSLLEIPLEVKQKGLSIAFKPKCKIILLQHGADRIDPMVQNSFQVVTLRITRDAIRGLFQHILFKKFTPGKFADYFDSLVAMRDNETAIQDLEVTLFSVLGEKIDTIVNNAELNDKLVRTKTDLATCNMLFRKAREDQVSTMQHKQRFQAASEELANCQQLLARMESLDAHQDFSLATFLKVLSDFTAAMTDRALGFNDSFNRMFYASLLQLLVPQLQHGHKELLAFALLSCQSMTEKDSPDMQVRMNSAKKHHQFSKLLGGSFGDYFLDRSRKHLTTVEYFIRMANMVELKFKHLKGQNTLQTQKTIDLSVKKTTEESRHVIDIDSKPKDFYSDSENEEDEDEESDSSSLHSQSWSSSSLKSELFEDEPVKSNLGRQNAYNDAKIKLAKQELHGFELRQIEYKFRQECEKEQKSLRLQDPTVGSFFRDFEVNIVMRLIPKNTGMSNLDMKSLRLTMILGDRFNTTSIKENASSKGGERNDLQKLKSAGDRFNTTSIKENASSKGGEHNDLQKLQSVKTDQKLEDISVENYYDNNENIVINDDACKPEKETPLIQDKVEKIKKRDSFKASLSDFDNIPVQNLTLLNPNNQRSSILKKSKTMESVEFDKAAEKIVKVNSDVFQRESYIQLQDLQHGIPSTVKRLMENNDLTLIEGVTKHKIETVISDPSMTLHQIKHLFDFDKTDLDLLQIVKVVKPHFLFEAVSEQIVAEYNLDSWANYLNECYKNINYKLYPRTVIFESEQEYVHWSVDKTINLVWDESINNFYESQLAAGVGEDRKILLNSAMTARMVHKVESDYQAQIKLQKKNTSQLKTRLFYRATIDGQLQPQRFGRQALHSPLSLSEFNLVYNYLRNHQQSPRPRPLQPNNHYNRHQLQSSVYSQLDLIIVQTGVLEQEVGSNTFFIAILVLSVLLTCKMHSNSFNLVPLANIRQNCAKIIELFDKVEISETYNFDGLGQLLGRLMLCDTQDMHVYNTLNFVVVRLFKFHLRQAQTNLQLFNTAACRKEQTKTKQKISRQMFYKFTGAFKDENKSKIVQDYIQEHFFNPSFYQELFNVKIDRDWSYLKHDELQVNNLIEGLKSVNANTASSPSISVQPRYKEYTNFLRYCNTILSLEPIKKEVSFKLDENFVPKLTKTVTIESFELETGNNQNLDNYETTPIQIGRGSVLSAVASQNSVGENKSQNDLDNTFRRDSKEILQVNNPGTRSRLSSPGPNLLPNPELSKSNSHVSHVSHNSTVSAKSLKDKSDANQVQKQNKADNSNLQITKSKTEALAKKEIATVSKENASKENVSKENASIENDNASKENISKENENASKENENVSKENENASKENENASKENENASKENENAPKENASQALRRISNLAHQKDIPIEKDSKGKVRRNSDADTIISDHSLNNDVNQKQSRTALEKSPQFIWLQSEAESFNQQLSDLKYQLNNLMTQVANQKQIDMEDSAKEIVDLIEAQITPHEFKRFKFAYKLDFQAQLLSIMKSRNHIQKLVRQPWRRAFRFSALLHPAKLLNALKLSQVQELSAGGSCNLRNQFYYRAEAVPHTKVRELYEKLGPSDPALGVFQLKGSVCINAAFDARMTVVNKEHIMTANSILRVTISQRNTWLYYNIRRNLLKLVAQGQNEADDNELVFNCPVYIKSDDSDQKIYFHIEAFGKVEEFQYRGVCIKMQENY